MTLSKFVFMLTCGLKDKNNIIEIFMLQRHTYIHKHDK